MARHRPEEEELPKVPLTRETLREAYGLLRYLWPYRVKFAGALLALFLGSVCWLAFPFLVGTLIDSALPRLGLSAPRPADLDRAALTLLAVLALQAGFVFLRARWFI